MSFVDVLSATVKQLEGPYKWYIIGIVVLILTAGITKYIFKTFKWMIVVMIIGILIAGLLWSLVIYTGL